MASYVDNRFRQAVMMNPAERTQQVRRIYLFYSVKPYVEVSISTVFDTLIHCFVSAE